MSHRWQRHAVHYQRWFGGDPSAAVQERLLRGWTLSPGAGPGWELAWAGQRAGHRLPSPAAFRGHGLPDRMVTLQGQGHLSSPKVNSYSGLWEGPFRPQ